MRSPVLDEDLRWTRRVTSHWAWEERETAAAHHVQSPPHVQRAVSGDECPRQRSASGGGELPALFTAASPVPSRALGS